MADSALPFRPPSAPVASAQERGLAGQVGLLLTPPGGAAVAGHKPRASGNRRASGGERAIGARQRPSCLAGFSSG